MARWPTGRFSLRIALEPMRNNAEAVSEMTSVRVARYRFSAKASNTKPMALESIVRISSRRFSRRSMT
ncbi:hypothetical protein D3C78_1727390 [compost metagenome]